LCPLEIEILYTTPAAGRSDPFGEIQRVSAEGWGHIVVIFELSKGVVGVVAFGRGRGRWRHPFVPSWRNLAFVIFIPGRNDVSKG